MELTKPARTFDLTVNGEKTTITMSYGLFNEVMRVIPSPEQITDLVVRDPFLRDYVIRRMLTGNKRVESDADLIDAFDLDLDLEELDSLVNWVAEHVLHFFTNSVQKTAKTGEKYQAVIEALAASTQSNQSVPGAAN